MHMHKYLLVALDTLRYQQERVLEIECDGLHLLFRVDPVTSHLRVHQHRSIVEQGAECSYKRQIQHTVPNDLIGPQVQNDLDIK